MAEPHDIAVDRAPVAGTAWRGRPGWMVVAGKELAETLTSIRFAILMLLLIGAAAVPVYVASGAIREAAEEASEASALFLAVFTIGVDRIPSFVGLVGFIAPLLGIAFGFDAVNGERAQGTLARLLSHPIYRDDLVNGKFVAGLIAIGFAVVSITLLVAGIAIWRLGIVPAPGEVARLLVWVLVTIVYIGLWLALATLCSVLVSRAATSALIAIGLWLGLSLFAVLLVQALAGAIGAGAAAGGTEAALDRARLEELLAIVNPATVYSQATLALLNPGVTAVNVPALAQAIQLSQQIPTQLSLQQSLLIVWPQVVGLLAAMVACFVASYVVFLRQEVRA
jgi:ABC-2 type transport system permease protein